MPVSGMDVYWMCCHPEGFLEISDTCEHGRDKLYGKQRIQEGIQLFTAWVPTSMIYSGQSLVTGQLASKGHGGKLHHDRGLQQAVGNSTRRDGRVERPREFHDEQPLRLHASLLRTFQLGSTSFV